MATIFNENSIRPRKLINKQQRYISDDVKYLLKEKKRFVRIHCPACGSKKEHLEFYKRGFRYSKCDICQTVYMNPRPTIRIITNFLARSKNYKYWNDVIFPASEQTRKQNIFKPRVDRVLKICKRHRIPTKQIIEVGCGFGTFLEELKARNVFSSMIGIEPTPNLAMTCKKKGIETINKTIEEIPAKSLKANVVVCFEVIEHIFSPSQFLSACHNILNDNGIIIITCPNVKGFDMQTLGIVSDTIDHEHLNYFHLDSLNLLLKKVGFEVIENQTPGVLDADLVRNKILEKKFKLQDPFLQIILLDQWDKMGTNFQKFLQENLLSSNMWVVAKKL